MEKKISFFTKSEYKSNRQENQEKKKCTLTHIFLFYTSCGYPIYSLRYLGMIYQYFSLYEEFQIEWLRELTRINLSVAIIRYAYL